MEWAVQRGPRENGFAFNIGFARGGGRVPEALRNAWHARFENGQARL